MLHSHTADAATHGGYTREGFAIPGAVAAALRRLVEDQRETGHDIAASICEEAADHIDDLIEHLAKNEATIDEYQCRLQELECLFEGLATVCDRARLACNLSEGDAVPVLTIEVRR